MSKSKVKTSEILNLLKAQKFVEIKDQLIDINQPIDVTGYTILMYATAYRDQEAIKVLLKYGANPFKTDNYGNSAFSIAFSQEMEDVAKEFVENKISFNELKQHIELVNALANPDKGSFSYYIASHVCTNNADLRDSLGFSTEGAKSCFTQAKEYYELLGEDSMPLLGTYEIA